MTISTHVLDTSIGRPAAGVDVRLQRAEPAAAGAERSAHGPTTTGASRTWPPAQSGAGGYCLTLRRRRPTFAARRRLVLLADQRRLRRSRDADGALPRAAAREPLGYSTYRGS